MCTVFYNLIRARINLLLSPPHTLHSKKDRDKLNCNIMLLR